MDKSYHFVIHDFHIHSIDVYPIASGVTKEEKLYHYLRDSVTILKQ